jgi:hypothetical protein
MYLIDTVVHKLSTATAKTSGLKMLALVKRHSTPVFKSQCSMLD